MDLDRLMELYKQIPPRQPRGSPSNLDRISAKAKFGHEAIRQGLTISEAFILCHEKSVRDATSPST